MENTGGVGGITGLIPYYYLDLSRALADLCILISSETEIIFIPSNQLRFCHFLVDFIERETCLTRSDMLVLTSTTASCVLAELIDDCKRYSTQHLNI